MTLDCDLVVSTKHRQNLSSWVRAPLLKIKYSKQREAAEVSISFTADNTSCLKTGLIGCNGSTHERTVSSIWLFLRFNAPQFVEIVEFIPYQWPKRYTLGSVQVLYFYHVVHVPRYLFRYIVF